MWQLNGLRCIAVFVVAAVVSVAGCHSAARHSTSPVLPTSPDRPFMIVKAIVFDAVSSAKGFFDAALTALTRCSGWTDEINGALVTSE